MSTKPSLVFIPGAWHLSSCWDKVVQILVNSGYSCICPELPTVSSNPKANFQDDFNAIRNVVVAETQKGNDVVIVSHSYGGMVGNSVIKGLAHPKEKALAKTDQGYVIGNVLMASGFTQSGIDFLTTVGGKPPPIWEMKEDTGLADLIVPARELFYHDLPTEEGEFWVSKLQPHSLGAFREHAELAYAGWQDVPNWYLLTTEDKTHPAEVQRMMIKMVKDIGTDVQAREIATSHSPMLSKPRETAEFVQEAVASFTARHEQ